MVPYIFRRFIQFFPTFILATILVFFIIQAAPGDFLSQLKVNPRVTATQLARLRHDFGLDQPVIVQYLKWMWNMLHGDLGESFSAHRPVLEVVLPRAANSMILVVLSTVILFLVAIPIGIYSALHPYSFADRAMTFVSYLFLGLPSFFFALLALFAMVTLRQNYGWDVPISGKTSANLPENANFLMRSLDILKHALIPSIILVLRGISSESRFIRGYMLETLGQDFIRTARAKGLAQNAVVYKHALRIALIPFIAGLGGLLPGLLSGAGFVEVVYSYPGLTPLVLDALSNTDVYVLSSVTALSTILYIVGNLLSDLLLAVADPRISYH